jgi:hypothetical protein
MDDKDEKTVSGGVIGAAIGGLLGGPAGAAVGAAVVGGVNRSQGLDEHDQTVLDTFNNINETADETKIYTDHVSPNGIVGNPRGEVPRLDQRVPDVVVKQQGGTQLIVEVEREGSLDNEAVKQLKEFTSATGYTTLLVVPEDATRPPAKQFIADNSQSIDGQVTVATPVEVPDYL